MPSSPWITLGMQWIATPSTAVASAFALVSSLLFFRARKRYLALPPLPAVPAGETPPNCMVVIPARNEEGVVGAAVASFPPDTVIVVDDHSTDKTTEEARAAGAGVLEAPPVPKGALGKASACMAGAKLLTSRWILFADADTRYQEGFLDSIVSYADGSGLALLSVHLTPRPRGLTGHLIEPYTTALFFSGAGRGDPTAMFNGECVLANREAYQFIGCHAVIWKTLAEALNLAIVARRHRMKFAVMRADGLAHVLSPSGLKNAWRGVQRKGFRFAHMNPWNSVAILFTAVFAALWMPLAAWGCFDGYPITAALLTLVVMLQLRPWYGSKPGVLLAPLAIYAALPLVLHGLIGATVPRHMVWKGRRIKAT